MQSRISFVAIVFLGSFLVYCAQDVLSETDGDGPIGSSAADAGDGRLADDTSDPSFGEGSGGSGGDSGATCAVCPRPEPVVLIDETIEAPVAFGYQGTTPTTYAQAVHTDAFEISEFSSVVVHVTVCETASVEYWHGEAAGWVPIITGDLNGDNSDDKWVFQLVPAYGSRARLSLKPAALNGDRTAAMPMGVTVVGIL